MPIIVIVILIILLIVVMLVYTSISLVNTEGNHTIRMKFKTVLSLYHMCPHRWTMYEYSITYQSSSGEEYGIELSPIDTLRYHRWYTKRQQDEASEHVAKAIQSMQQDVETYADLLKKRGVFY